MFFGDVSGKVHWFDGASNDNGDPIHVTAQSAWDYLGSAGSTKHHKMQRLTFTSEVMPQVSVALGSDFRLIPPGQTLTLQSNTDVSYWNEAYWDENYFGPDLDVVQGWVKCPARGFVTSCRVTAYVTDAELAWNNIRYVYEMGGLI